MSNFSKRAKFLSILAAASAVGNAGAGATTIPDNKYIPASSAAQSASRISLKPANGSNFNIKSFLAGFGSAAAASVVAFLAKNYFFNEERSNINLLIQALKEYKVVCLKFEVSPLFTGFKAFDSDGSEVDTTDIHDDDVINKLAGIDKNKDKNKDKNRELYNRTKRKVITGTYYFCNSLPVCKKEFKVKVFAGKDGKIYIGNKEIGYATEEKFEKMMDEGKKKYGEELIKEIGEFVHGILDNKLVKEVLGHAIEKKLSYNPGPIRRRGRMSNVKELKIDTSSYLNLDFEADINNFEYDE